MHLAIFQPYYPALILEESIKEEAIVSYPLLMWFVAPPGSAGVALGGAVFASRYASVESRLLYLPFTVILNEQYQSVIALPKIADRKLPQSSPAQHHIAPI